MRLPYLRHAVVPRDKVEGYLLSEAHPDGRAKAGFFRGFGFSADDWELLREALLAHVREHHVATVDTSAFGTRYTVEGRLRCPDGREPRVRSVWFVDSASTTPRLVTAYPHRKERDDDS